MKLSEFEAMLPIPWTSLDGINFKLSLDPHEEDDCDWLLLESEKNGHRCQLTHMTVDGIGELLASVLSKAPTEEESRERFEKEMRSHGYTGSHLYRNPDNGHYLDPVVSLPWALWQACNQWRDERDAARTEAR